MNPQAAPLPVHSVRGGLDSNLMGRLRNLTFSSPVRFRSTLGRWKMIRQGWPQALLAGVTAGAIAIAWTLRKQFAPRINPET